MFYNLSVLMFDSDRKKKNEKKNDWENDLAKYSTILTIGLQKIRPHHMNRESGLPLLTLYAYVFRRPVNICLKI